LTLRLTTPSSVIASSFQSGPALDTSNMPAHVLNWLCA
jgi:hypothetical protein